MRRYLKVKASSFNMFETTLISICVISNISQLPFLVNNNIIKLLIMLSWLMFLFFIVTLKYKDINLKNLNAIWILLMFDIFILLVQLFTGKNYIKSNFIYPIHLSFFIFTLSYLLGQFLNEDIIKKVLKAFIYSSIVVAVYILFNTFIGVDWASSGEYLYTAKNSISTVFALAILCSIFYLNNVRKAFKVSVIIFLSIILLMLKSRSNIMALVMTIGFMIFFITKGVKRKIIFIVVISAIALIILTNDNLYNLLINNILLNNKGTLNLNAITSGRIEHVEYFRENFRENMFIGTGGLYLESFPLALLMSYGILGALPIFILSIFPLIIVYKYRKKDKDNKIRSLIILMNILLLINGLFEELAPFGPGVKCYLLWMITGIYLGLKTKSDLNRCEYSDRNELNFRK